MKVFITGASGFIGGNLVRRLVEKGYRVKALVRPGSKISTALVNEVEIVEGDILDFDTVLRGVSECGWVFHCAAAYKFWARDPRDIYKTNVNGTDNVLVAAHLAGVERIVYTSTVGTIGLPKVGLGNETTPLPPHQVVGNYKRSKYLAEKIVLKKATAGIPVIVVNPTAPVGAWDVKPTPTGKVILDFLKQKMPAYVHTGLNFVDVSDVAEGHILAAIKGTIGERYILGNQNMSLLELFENLQELSGRKRPRLHIPNWIAMGVGQVDDLLENKILRREPKIPLEGIKMAQICTYVSSQKAVDQLGFPQSPVNEALNQAIQWFRDKGYY
ncbi:MAG: hopanoid-associated sugar epimerase [Chloroflexota bacterium]|nr:hopanoid-associated sugar epimerase [Chloroflexota bacterium]